MTERTERVGFRIGSKEPRATGYAILGLLSKMTDHDLAKMDNGSLLMLEQLGDYLCQRAAHLLKQRRKDHEAALRAAVIGGMGEETLEELEERIRNCQESVPIS